MWPASYCQDLVQDYPCSLVWAYTVLRLESRVVPMCELVSPLFVFSVYVVQY
jgi:hypothetical protein